VSRRQRRSGATIRAGRLALVGEVHGLRVLDAGCGPGFYAEELISRGADVVAADAAEAMVQMARHRLGSGAAVLRADLNAPLAFPDSESYLIVCLLVIHYLDDRVAALREFFRVWTLSRAPRPWPNGGGGSQRWPARQRRPSRPRPPTTTSRRTPISTCYLPAKSPTPQNNPQSHYPPFRVLCQHPDRPPPAVTTFTVLNRRHLPPGEA
jgi:SAM-dependent methyltransferase